MRSKRNRKQKPLFYINQPHMDMPRPVMQESFICKNEELDTYAETENEKENGQVPVKTEIVTNDSETETETETETDTHTARQELSTEIEKVNRETEPDQARKKKTFNDYSLEEKIKHLKLVPASVAKVRYEFITIERSYKGYFLSMKDGAMIIHSTSPRKKSVSILEEELVDIKRIGL
jgi:hypothetical protein